MIQLKDSLESQKHTVFLYREGQTFETVDLTPDEKKYLTRKTEAKSKKIVINRYDYALFFIEVDDKTEHGLFEKARLAASKLHPAIQSEKINTLQVVDLDQHSGVLLAFAEGLMLKNYQFLKYQSDTEDKKNVLEKIHIVSSSVAPSEVDELNFSVRAVYIARNLINEPVSYLSAEMLAAEAVKWSLETGFKAEVLHKEKIEALRMGGVLGVNRGSIEPPTFSILEWKPENAQNDKPIVLVGKGVVYDTGGLSLKPTANSMDMMKSDMSGAAAVIGVMGALALAKVPLHVVGLIPATDNRPDGNAYTPGDVLTMYNGKTVEVLNTDAEGRLILADAISYASKFDPEFIVDIATLTGSAALAIGKEGVVAMGNVKPEIFTNLKESGDKVYERIAEFPFWDEYAESLKSEIADMKNIGSREGGAISAGKFLEKFTDYPFLHLDIAGGAYFKSCENYRGCGGTGIGVRLLFHFLRSFTK